MTVIELHPGSGDRLVGEMLASAFAGTVTARSLAPDTPADRGGSICCSANAAQARRSSGSEMAPSRFTSYLPSGQLCPALALLLEQPAAFLGEPAGERVAGQEGAQLVHCEQSVTRVPVGRVHHPVSKPRISRIRRQ